MVEDTSPIADSPVSPPLFLEVFCQGSGKDYRFSTGTKAEFAVSVINRKLGSLKSRVVYIEAMKEGEEPISFGDNACLVDYGNDWKLNTVTDDAYLPGTEKTNLSQKFPSVLFKGSKDLKSTRDSKPEVEGEQSLRYIGRIFVAFVLMFVLGGLFTVALENLPRLISCSLTTLPRELLTETVQRHRHSGDVTP